MFASRRILGVIALAAAGCTGNFPRAEGTVAVDASPDLGSFSKPAGTCSLSGAVDFGVVLSNGTGTLLEADRDPVRGDLVELPIPGGGSPVTAYAKDCSQLELTFTPTDGYPDELDGSLDAECALPGGGHLSAHVTFANCY